MRWSSPCAMVPGARRSVSVFEPHRSCHRSASGPASAGLRRAPPSCAEASGPGPVPGVRPCLPDKGAQPWVPRVRDLPCPLAWLAPGSRGPVGHGAASPEGAGGRLPSSALETPVAAPPAPRVHRRTQEHPCHVMSFCVPSTWGLSVPSTVTDALPGCPVTGQLIYRSPSFVEIINSNQ